MARRQLLLVLAVMGCGDGGSAEQGWDPANSSGEAATQTSATEGSSPLPSSTTAGASSGTSIATTTPPGTGADDSSSDGGAESSGGPPAPTFEVHYNGRFELEDAAGPRATWSGSTIRTRINGTGAAIGLDGPSGIRFQVAIDGAPTEVFVTDAGAQSYPVATGLPAGEHDIEVVRRNEGYFGVVQHTGFTLDPDTEIVQTPWPYALHIEFIGDSLTAGYGIECASGEKDFSAATQSAYTSYAMVAARQLEASSSLVAYSGKGVFQNYGGNTDEPMPVLFPRTFTGQAEPEWDWLHLPADVVVVNLGTNDFSASIEQADFQSAYVTLLETVRVHYPSAEIMAVTWAHWGAEHESWVEMAVEQTGDGQTQTERFVIDADDGYGCDYHTNIVSNAKFGAQLADSITALGL